MKKRAIYSIAAVILCVSVVLGICLHKPRLSKMDEDECTQFLSDSGVISECYIETHYVQDMLAELEKDPEHHSPVVGDYTSIQLYEQLRVVVNMYYHRPKLPENTVLSQMDENECKKFLTAVGVRISDDFTMTTVQNLLAEFEKNHDFATPKNIKRIEMTFYDQLRIIVNMYYK